MSFSKDSYYREEFSALSLEETPVKGVTFEECEFESCVFVNCRFEGCAFLDCKFNECILSAIQPFNSRFAGVTFVKSKVIGFDWTKAKKIQDLVFDGCQINYSNFKLVKIPETKIVNCEAREVDFIEADLSGADFKNTDLTGSRFLKTNLSGANFKDAVNYAIDVKNNTIKGARFSIPEAMTLLDSLEVTIE